MRLTRPVFPVFDCLAQPSLKVVAARLSSVSVEGSTTQFDGLEAGWAGLAAKGRRVAAWSAGLVE